MYIYINTQSKSCLLHILCGMLGMSLNCMTHMLYLAAGAGYHFWLDLPGGSGSHPSDIDCRRSTSAFHFVASCPGIRGKWNAFIYTTISPGTSGHDWPEPWGGILEDIQMTHVFFCFVVLFGNDGCKPIWHWEKYTTGKDIQYSISVFKCIFIYANNWK